MIRFFFYCTSYLSDFAWIIRSKNFASTTSPLFQRPVPVVLRVQRYCFFLSLQHFFKIFFTYFHFFHYPLKLSGLQTGKRKTQAEKRRNRPGFALPEGGSAGNSRRKISQNPTFSGKNDADPWILLSTKGHESGTKRLVRVSRVSELSPSAPLHLYPPSAKGH